MQDDSDRMLLENTFSFGWTECKNFFNMLGHIA